ncbi:hypothetical protein [Spiroplasma endosymbiont of Nomada rufipes]|uniref:hypothetical protein n=1 Tax=Spiroplasma endosymbiont of Nomada rufipes TaxID=3077933 RepID=UPI00376EDA17
MKFLYENFLQFYLIALTSIIQQIKLNYEIFIYNILIMICYYFFVFLLYYK